MTELDEQENAEDQITQPVFINSGDRSSEEIIFIEHSDLPEVERELTSRGYRRCHYYTVETSQYYIFSCSDGLVIVQTDNLNRTLLMFRQINKVRLIDMFAELDKYEIKENSQLVRTDTLKHLLKDWLKNKLK